MRIRHGQLAFMGEIFSSSYHPALFLTCDVYFEASNKKYHQRKIFQVVSNQGICHVGKTMAVISRISRATVTF